jgi:hypothetical protein
MRLFRIGAGRSTKVHKYRLSRGEPMLRFAATKE